MSREREAQHLVPPLARYLGSLETRNRYLRNYRNIQILEQNEQDGYYVFEADGRKKESPLKSKLRAEVFLSENGMPYYARLRNYGRYETGEISIVEYKDFETVLQGKLLRVSSTVEPQVVFLYSIRSHQRKNRGGIHCVYRSNGILERVELSTPQGSIATCKKFPELDEVEIEYSQILELGIPLPVYISRMHGEAAIVGSALNFKATNEVDNAVFTSQVAKVINPAICREEMDVPDVSWVNIFKQLPFQLEIATSEAKSDEQDKVDDPTI